MNRFIQTILFLIPFFSSVIGQEGNPAPMNRDSMAVSGDTLTMTRDSMAVSGDTLTMTRDTLSVNRDTLSVPYDTLGIHSYYDSIYRTSEPELWAARKREADSLRADSVYDDSKITSEALETKSPSKAIMYALVLPGLGQAYNGKYWKMPIVWAAIGGAGYAIAYNTGEYKQASYDYAQNPDDLNERYLGFWRRNMELSYIAMIAVYALQVLDAYVDAQLFSWDVNENLSIGVSPALKPLMSPGSIKGYSYGLGCNFNIRGR